VTSDIIGRDREQAMVDAFLADLAHPRALVIEGSTGIGKTTLWREAVRRAQAHATVLSCRPVESEASLAFGGLIDLFERVDDGVLSRLPEPQRAALEVALLRRPAAGTVPDALAVAAGARGGILELARRRPVVIAIDDVQWLDPSSATVLAYLMRRLVSEPVVLVMAIRAGTNSSAAWLGDAPGLETERIRLESASLSTLHHIVRSRTGVVLPRPVLHRIAEASGGNPMYAIELAAALLESGTRPAPGDPLPVSESLADLVARRVGRLAAPAQEALLVTASLASPTSDLVDLALGRDTSGSLEAAREAGILETGSQPLRFVHPLFAHAVVRLASPEARRRAHRAIAASLSEPEERARHLALGATPPDAGIGDALEAGARAARFRGALRAAAELLEQAARFTPASDPARAQERIFEAAELYVLAGDRPRARGLLDEVIAVAGGALGGRSLGLLAEIVANEGRVGDAQALLAHALEAVEEPVVGARLELDLVYMALLQLDTSRAAAHALRAADHAGRSSEQRLRAEAIAMEALARFLDGEPVGEPRLTEAMALEDRARPPYLGLTPRGVAGLVNALAGRHSRARLLFDEARAGLEAMGDECDLAHIQLWRSWLETRSGSLAQASELAAEAATIAEMTGSHLLRAWALAQAALVEAYRGDPERTSARVEDVRRGGIRLDGLVGMWLAAAGGLAALAVGDARAAWAAMQHATERIEGAPIREPVAAFFLPDAVEALARSGGIDRARRLLEPFEAAARTAARPWAVAAALRARGFVEGAAGNLAGALDAFAMSVEAYAGLDMALDRARALLGQGQAARRNGERRAARDALTEALRAFEQAGAGGWAAAAAAELRRVPGRRSAAGVLTASELRVAELSGAGRTNRDVAGALFLSPKTVEANLARVYRKLGITTRAELGAWVASRQDPETAAKPR